eukprot:CAMPEP_0197627298 /NCGR_PEP_ID=MMETSP1338-20131121/5946_1 /TAXON_ID=43686 ORGANISM="Pelagodinium beii, Strain RCC1491" /NCGR_SAMPLE_ID=MMETSP1338 /ASSEMBLY_ACC=CAM_ASM_000754 /LENGTH=166 /DNA_ID=CAMNT_0043197985 /DNA_START=77 /DNA_END=578 /DNA_ORIENTATION=+
MAFLTKACLTLQVLAFLQTLVSARGDIYDEVTPWERISSAFSKGVVLEPDFQTFESFLKMVQAATLGGMHVLDVEPHDYYKCMCVEDIYVDKCKSCMCGTGSTSWCNTACDPSGNDPENSCCQPFKKEGDVCDQNWECGWDLVSDKRFSEGKGQPQCWDGRCKTMR